MTRYGYCWRICNAPKIVAYSAMQWLDITSASPSKKQQHRRDCEPHRMKWLVSTPFFTMVRGSYYDTLITIKLYLTPLRRPIAHYPILDWLKLLVGGKGQLATECLAEWKSSNSHQTFRDKQSVSFSSLPPVWARSLQRSLGRTCVTNACATPKHCQGSNPKVPPFFKPAAT